MESDGEEKRESWISGQREPVLKESIKKECRKKSNRNQKPMSFSLSALFSRAD